ncbi:HDOD domain-containing protein [bacterium]|nr:HDOD domain-containing protein [bacterium]
MRNKLNITKTDRRLKKRVEVLRKSPAVAHVVSKKRLGEEMISRVDELPALPTVVSKIMALIEDNNSNAQNLEQYLKQDQALAARLLRIVNSSFFGLPNRISSISQAIVIIGYNSLKNLVLAASTSKLLEGVFPGYGFKEGGLWQHAFMAATWASKLSSRFEIDTEEADELFIAGLLHDVGKLVLSSYITINCKEMMTNLITCNGNIEEAEKALVGISHSEIGSRIAQKWNFSDKLAHIIKYHHNASCAVDYQKETALIELVNYCLVSKRYGMFENIPIDVGLSQTCLKQLKLTSEKILELTEEIEESAEGWETI